MGLICTSIDNLLVAIARPLQVLYSSKCPGNNDGFGAVSRATGISKPRDAQLAAG